MTIPIAWTPERDTQLAILAKTLSDQGIAKRMCVSRESIRKRRTKLCIPSAKPRPPRVERFIAPARISFPMFENITSTEAQQIRHGIPKSGRFRKAYDLYSLSGNAAALCAL